MKLFSKLLKPEADAAGDVALDDAPPPADEVPVEDRRQHPRRAVLWVGELGLGGATFDCQVWNVSLSGAKLRASLPLGPGTPVDLTLPRFGVLPANVVWRSGNELGLAFSSTEEVRAALGETVGRLGLGPGAPGAE